MDKTQEAAVITKDALNDRIRSGTPFQLVNVLDPQYYSLGVIRGSIKIPLAELERRSTELDRSKEIVTYCTDTSCDASRKAAKLLAGKGFKVSAYTGGLKEWTASGLPIEPTTTTVPAAITPV